MTSEIWVVERRKDVVWEVLRVFYDCGVLNAKLAFDEAKALESCAVEFNKQYGGCLDQYRAVKYVPAKVSGWDKEIDA